ncbi:MAG: kynureninase [Bacteroidales bacterium]
MKFNKNKTERQFAVDLDTNDQLSKFRNRFYIPDDTIYFDGNSLGLLSKDAEDSLSRVLNEWKTKAIGGWLKGQRPWFYFAEEIGEMASKIVGAKPKELVLTGTTTVNIHALISTFYQPKGIKTKILADELNFPSDIYALEGQLKLKGYNPDEHLLLVPSDDGNILNEQHIVDMMTEEVAVIFLPSVLYRSGQLLDMEYLTKEAHKKDIFIGFDCSHSAGAVPHHFNDWGVDFALFCSYKYLNGGPGCSAFLYINEKHFDKEPMLPGWFGYKKEKQFDLLIDFEHQKSAGGWQISSPGILGTSPIEGALNITLEAGIENIRKKSVHLTSYLICLIEDLLENAQYQFNIITPKNPDKRSGHVAITHKTDTYRINEALKARGVVPDFRPPDIIRLAPIALYNTFDEVWQVVNHLKEIVDQKEYLNFSDDKSAIT